MVPLRSHLAEGLNRVAPIANLLYRRFVTCLGIPSPCAKKNSAAPPIANRACHGGSRLQIHAARQVWLTTILLLPLLLPSSHGAELSPIITKWLAAQTNIHTWSAQVTQTRRLKTLTQPLIAQGQVWFSAPNLFRWEIGSPASTIAIRQPKQMLVIYPRLKRAEKFPLDAAAQGPWKDILSLLEAGFPRGPQDVDNRFEILNQTVTNQICRLEMQPISAAARHMMPRLEVSFSTETYALQATELEFADGSTMRNEFHDAVINPPIEEQLFNPNLPEDITVVEPNR